MRKSRKQRRTVPYRITRGARHTSVQLRGRQYDHGNVGARVLLGDVIADRDGHGPDDKDGQELETDHTLRLSRNSQHYCNFLLCLIPVTAAVCSGPGRRPDCHNYRAGWGQKKTYQIHTGPPLVGPRINHPQLREGIRAAGLRAVHEVGTAEEVVRVRVETRRDGVDGGERQRGEEAVIEETPLEAEVDQRVKGMPNEEETEAGGGR